MSAVLASRPASREKPIQGKSFRKYSQTAVPTMSMGKKRSFMCSHVDSLTGVNSPIKLFCPDQS